MVRYCDQCGSELKEHAIFCSKCGAKCDLPPESVKNESTDKKVIKTVNSSTDSVKDDVDETGTSGTKSDDIINKTNENSTGDFNVNNINWNVVIKYSIAGTIVSLIIGIILCTLFYGNPMMQYSFIIGLIVSVLLFTAHIKDKTNAIIVGLVAGLLTCILQPTAIPMFIKMYWSPYFSFTPGEYGLLLIVIGSICGYIGNVYLRDKINFPIINQYLGE